MAFVSQDRREPSKTYVYSSRPRVVEKRPKYREAAPEQTSSSYGNTMNDSRVVRGNTHAQHSNPTMAPPDQSDGNRQQPIWRRSMPRNRARGRNSPLTPEPMPGRQHIDVQTDRYLEELSDIIQTMETEIQTDAFKDRPPSPLFIPAKSGKDAETQIEEGELFDFDREVEPVLEVLVGKTIEQSLEEVMEEEELARLKEQQRAYEELRNNELAEVQRLQEQERRRREEKERRIAQEREVLKKEKETAEKIAARAYTQRYLAGLLPAVFTSLRSHGYFYDSVQLDIETNFMPWLMEEVHYSLDKRYAAREVLDNIIFDIAEMRMEMEEELQADSSNT